MSKIDCSITLNYAKERERMCNMYDDCKGCPFQYINDCGTEIDQEHIDLVQKWSDVHPQITRKEKFIKLCKENGFEKVAERIEKRENSPSCHSCAVCLRSNSCDQSKAYWNEEEN